MPEHVYYIGAALIGLAAFIAIVAGIPKED